MMIRNPDRSTVVSLVIGVRMVATATVVTLTTPHCGLAQATEDRPSPKTTPRASQPAGDPLQPGSVVVQLGWLWYSPQLLTEPVQEADRSTVAALLKRFQTILDRTNSGDGRPASWVLLSLSCDPQQLSRQDVAEGIAVRFPDPDSWPLIRAVPSRNADGRALAGDSFPKADWTLEPSLRKPAAWKRRTLRSDEPKKIDPT